MFCPSIESLYAYTIILVVLVIVLSGVAMQFGAEKLPPWIAGIAGLIYLWILGSFAISNAGFAECDRPVQTLYPGSVAAAAVTTA